MIFSLFRKDPRRTTIATLYKRIATASRSPGLYAALGIPDTLEGRFEALSLHMVLALRALRELPHPADEVAKDLTDAFFRDMDAEERVALPARPLTTAEQAADGSGWRLHGVKTVVRAGTAAGLVLVTAGTPDGVGVFALAPDTPGLRVVAQRTSDGDRVARLELDGALAEPVGVPGDGAATRLAHLLVVTAAAEQLGVTEGALHLTSTYAKTREQFGRPIGTFQAVSQRLADGYIDVLGQRLTLWQAAWRLAEGLPAEVEVATAKLWAADAGHRLAHTAVHVHGGVGIDLDGEAHRYFTSAKRFEFLFGGATEQALLVGRALADDPA